MDIKKTIHSNHNSEHQKKPKYNLVASLKKMTSSPMDGSQITTLLLYLLITRTTLARNLVIAIYQAAVQLIGKMILRIIILILMIILINQKYLSETLFSTEMMKNQRKALLMPMMIVTNRSFSLPSSIVITHKIAWLNKSLMNCLIMR